MAEPLVDLKIQGDEKLRRSFERVEGEFRKRRVLAMRRILDLLDREAQRRLRPRKRRGKLANLFQKIDARADDVSGRIGPRVPYGRIIERGGIIKPKRRKWITIPLPAAQTSQRVAQHGARKFANTFFAKSKAGNLLLFQNRGGQAIPLFVLKKSVRIPKRPYLLPAARAKQARIVEEMGDAYVASVR